MQRGKNEQPIGQWMVVTVGRKTEITMIKVMEEEERKEEGGGRKIRRVEEREGAHKEE